MFGCVSGRITGRWGSHGSVPPLPSLSIARGHQQRCAMGGPSDGHDVNAAGGGRKLSPQAEWHVGLDEAGGRVRPATTSRRWRRPKAVAASGVACRSRRGRRPRQTATTSRRWRRPKAVAASGVACRSRRGRRPRQTATTSRRWRRPKAVAASGVACRSRRGRRPRQTATTSRRWRRPKAVAASEWHVGLDEAGGLVRPP